MSNCTSIQTTLVDGLKLHAEEHRCHIGQHERCETLHLDTLYIRHVVVAIEHVLLGGDMDELAVRFVRQRHQFQPALRALHGVLQVLTVIRQPAVGLLITLAGLLR